MQQTSELYRQLLADGNHVKRHRLFVDGLEYGHSEILRSVEVGDVLITQPPEVTGELFADGKPGVGGCVAKQLDIVFLPREEPPRMAEMILETQLVLRDPATGAVTAESEWVPQGVFYIDKRKTIDLQDPDHPLGALQVHGYDGMLQLEAIYLRDGEDLTAVPDTMPEMAADIADRIGTVIDPRTQLKPYAVSPPFGYTMREIMGWIAAAHGGNWILTGTGEFLLRPLAGIPAEDGFLVTEDGDDILLGDVRLVVSDSDTGGKGGAETYVGRSASSLSVGKQFTPYTGVTFWYDDEAAFRDGDDTGRMLEADCIWATQTMADAVLEAVRGFRYRPFAATGAAVDPAAELGDGITVGGVYSVLASMVTIYDAVTASDIAAPGEEEVDSEYPYTSPETRQLQRKLTLGKSYYGVRITRQNGLEAVTQMPDGSTGAKAIYNSEKIAMTNADGEECIYFDTKLNRYRYRGDVEVDGYISGNEILTKGTFSVGYDSGGFTPVGCLGPAYGKDASDAATYGITLTDAETASVADGVITYNTEGRYVIVTNKGVRLQAFDNNIALTKNNIYLSIRDASDERLQWINLSPDGAFYNGDSSNPSTEIATKYDLAHLNSVYGALQVLNANDDVTGWVGSGSGQASDGTPTYGVAMAASTTPILDDGGYSLDFDSAGRYILVTSEGIKLKSGENTRITLTDNQISVRTLNGATMNLNGSEVVTVAMLQSYGLI